MPTLQIGKSKGEVEKMKLLGRREIMAYGFTATTCIGFMLGKISAEQFTPLVSAVIAFYFGMRSKEKTNGG